MSTSLIIKAQGDSPLHGLTMEWGGFELNTELIPVQCSTAFISGYFRHVPWNAVSMMTVTALLDWFTLD